MNVAGYTRREPCYCENCTREPSSMVYPVVRRNPKRSVRNIYTQDYVKNTAGTPLRLQQSYGQPEVNKSGFAFGFRQPLTIFDSLYLNIFLANQIIYHEASTVFYSRNKFDFGGGPDYSESLENVSGFVQDRSKHALAHLKRIRFGFGGNIRDKFQRGGWYYSPELKPLCETFANCCQLVELDVGIFGSCFYPDSHPCLQQLCKIKGLRNLQIWICGQSDNGALESSLATIKTFRSQSLIDGDKMGEDDFDVSYGSGMLRVSTWKREHENDYEF